MDPVTAYGDPLLMFNRYRHAGSNPYRFRDPDGRCPIGLSHICGAMAVSVTLILPTGSGSRSPQPTIYPNDIERIPYTIDNAQERFDAAQQELKRLMNVILAGRTKTPDGIAAYFFRLAQPISTKYTVEIFFRSTSSSSGWRIEEAHVSNEFWSNGVGGGQRGDPFGPGETGGHTHPFNTPFSDEGKGAPGRFYLSRPDGVISVHNPYSGATYNLGINLWDY